MKFLDTNGGNPKIAKSGMGQFRVAGLSLLPSDTLCPLRHIADCAEPCLANQGRGRMASVRNSRARKTALWNADRPGFLAQLHAELSRFETVCHKTNVRPAVRLNVLSDIPWERHGIIESFPNVTFYDYTKLATRLGKTPENYHLIFSYSAAPKYQKHVRKALKTGAPIAAVFQGALPETFLNRPVIHGDADDLVNALAGPVVVGLSAKGTAKHSTSNLIAKG